MKRTSNVWLICLTLTAGAVVACFLWLDRPVALWVHDVIGAQRIPTQLSDSKIASIPNATAVIVFCVV